MKVGIYNENRELVREVEVKDVGGGKYELAEPVTLPEGWTMWAMVPGHLRLTDLTALGREA